MSAPHSPEHSLNGPGVCVSATGEVATVWAFNFFFYNKKMKRILYIGVKALSKTAAEEEEKVGTHSCCRCFCSCNQGRSRLAFQAA
jgi:hypothetical protein